MSLRVTFLVNSIKSSTDGDSRDSFDLTTSALSRLGFDVAAEVDRLFRQHRRALDAAERGIQRAAEFDYQVWVPKIADIYRAVTESGAEERSRTSAVARLGSLRW